MAVFVFALVSIWSGLVGGLWGRYGGSLHRRHRPWALAFLLLLLDSFDTRIFPWSIVMGMGSQREFLASVFWLGTWGWRVLFFGLLPIVYLWSRQPGLDGRRLAFRLVALFGVVLGGAWGLGAWQISRLEARYPERQPVILIQGNIGNFQKKLTKLGVEPTVNNVLRIHGDLFDRILNENYRGRPPEAGEAEPWYAWPETSFPGFPVSDPGQRAWVRERLDRTRGLHLIGAYDRAPQVEAGRRLILDFNIVALFHEAVGYVSHYEKVNLLAWGEYVPFGDRYPRLYEIFSAVNHFGRGLEAKELAHPDPEGPVFVPLICYEILMPGFVTDFVRKAEAAYPGRDVILVNPANDSWYGPTSQPSQHSLLARWEVARQGVPMIRPTNTGLSQVVAPWGEVLAVGPRDETTFVSGQIPVRKTLRLR